MANCQHALIRCILQTTDKAPMHHLPEAQDALDNLLSLAPKNTEALKLKGQIYSQEGRLLEEAKIWEQIFRFDNEDDDALIFFQQRQIEERESYYYFTDPLPDGGRGFLAHPIAASLALAD